MKTESVESNVTTEMELLKSHPLWAELKAKKAEEVQAQREAWAAEIVALEAEKSETLPVLQAKHKTALEAVKNAQAALRESERAAALAYSEQWSASHRIDSQIGFFQNQLLENFNPEIKAAIEYFRTEHDRLMTVSPTTYGEDLGLDVVNLERKFSRESNHPAITERLAYCREAVRLLESVKLEPGYSPELFERLKADLPSLENLTKYDGKRPTLRDVPDMVKAKIDCIIHDADFPGFMKRVDDYLKQPIKRAAAPAPQPKAQAVAAKKQDDDLMELPRRKIKGKAQAARLAKSEQICEVWTEAKQAMEKAQFRMF